MSFTLRMVLAFLFVAVGLQGVVRFGALLLGSRRHSFLETWVITVMIAMSLAGVACGVALAWDGGLR